jgi:hypothetical protein
MAFVAPSMPKKNSVRTTLSSGITNSDTTIPVTELSKFYDKDGALITKGIMIGFLNNNDIIPEEITITGASGTSGPGNLTGATRGVNADGSIGAAAAWDSGTEIAVMFTTGVYLIIKDDLNDLNTNKATKQIYDYKDLMIQGCSVPNTNPAIVDVEETGTNKNLLPYGQFTAAGENSEHLMWLVPFPDNWNSADADLGKIQFKFYWRPLTGTNDVKWQVAGKLLPDGDPLDVTLATIGTVEDTGQTTTAMHVTSFTTAAAVSSAGGGGNTALFSVTRQAPVGTDCAGDIRLYRVEIKYIRTLV